MASSPGPGRRAPRRIAQMRGAGKHRWERRRSIYRAVRRSGSRRARLAGLVSRNDLVAQRVADAIEKSPATYGVTPAFRLGTPDIFAKIKEIGPLLVGRGLWRTSKGRLPAVFELDLGTFHLAIGTADQEHGFPPLRPLAIPRSRENRAL